MQLWTVAVSRCDVPLTCLCWFWISRCLRWTFVLFPSGVSSVGLWHNSAVITFLSLHGLRHIYLPVCLLQLQTVLWLNWLNQLTLLSLLIHTFIPFILCTSHFSFRFYVPVSVISILISVFNKHINMQISGTLFPVGSLPSCRLHCKWVAGGLLLSECRTVDPWTKTGAYIQSKAV